MYRPVDSNHTVTNYTFNALWERGDTTAIIVPAMGFEPMIFCLRNRWIRPAIRNEHRKYLAKVEEYRRSESNWHEDQLTFQRLMRARVYAGKLQWENLINWELCNNHFANLPKEMAENIGFEPMIEVSLLMTTLYIGQR